LAGRAVVRLSDYYLGGESDGVIGRN